MKNVTDSEEPTCALSNADLEHLYGLWMNLLGLHLQRVGIPDTSDNRFCLHSLFTTNGYSMEHHRNMLGPLAKQMSQMDLHKPDRAS